MKTFCVLVIALGFAASGCVTRNKAQLEAKQAYVVGQEQAFQAQQHAQVSQGPSIFVQGPVQNPVVQWRDGMTLSQAIVDAYYTGFMNPRTIRVLRDGKVAGELQGIDLLRHQDLDLQPGDTVVVVP